MKYKSIGIMCGSSDACPEKYLNLAFEVGKTLGDAGRSLVYGGGGKGLMRRAADGALEVGAEVHGYMPKFMIAVEWQHPHLTNLHLTNDMSERKYKMMSNSDATVFLPGGCGTMEEFFEWMSAKRLGNYTGPLIVFNFDGYYNHLIEQLKLMEQEKFHNPIHSQMWSVCEKVEDLIQTIENAPNWDKDAISHAAVK